MSDAVSREESGAESAAPELKKPSWRPRTIFLAVAVVAIIAGATFLAAGDDVFDFWGSEPDACAVESATRSVDSSALPGVRQSLSDEPILQWRQVEPPVEDPSVLAHSDLHTTDDGRVAVVVEVGGVRRLESNGGWRRMGVVPAPPGSRSASGAYLRRPVDHRRASAR